MLALGPVSEAIYAVLDGDAPLAALVSGRIYDDVTQASVFPFLWYEVRERETRGFGTGGLPEVELRVHAFSTYAGQKESQAILDRVITLLKDQPLVMAGYEQAGRIFYDETVNFPDEEVNGVKARETVSLFRIYADQL